MTGETNTDRQTWIDINGSKLLHAHVQYVFIESAKYENLSTIKVVS